VVTVSYPPFDPEVDGPTGLVFAPEIEYVGYREALTDEFVYPPSSPYEFITANFKYKPLSAGLRMAKAVRHTGRAVRP
jgi:hypothetical protein